MKIGDKVYTPRFCTVRISKVFATRKEARDEGYTEPTYYEGECDVRGRSVDMYHMEFAAIEERR